MKRTISAVVVAVGFAFAQVVSLPVDPPPRPPTVIGDGSAMAVQVSPPGMPNTVNPTPIGISLVGPRSNPASGRLLNFSTRGSVGPAGQNLIAGFAVSEGDRILLLRAVGPTLAHFGISSFCPRPLLEVFDSNGVRLSAGLPWTANDPAVREELKNVANAVGAFALQEGTEDQVLLIFLRRGNYTCVVSGIAGSSGSVLLEAYDVPSLSGAQKG